MKRIISAVCIIVALAFLLGSCGYNDYRSKISKALGIDIPSGAPMKSVDTHGGFRQKSHRADKKQSRLEAAPA